MKVRAVTVGLHLAAEDLLEAGRLRSKLALGLQQAQALQQAFEGAGYTVQTLRLALNSFEQWLLPALVESNRSLVDVVSEIEATMEALQVQFCSFGPASSSEGISAIPDILAHSRASCSVALGSSETITADRALCEQAASMCFEIARRCGDLGNFRYCASFRCPPHTPFFPVAYHSGADSVATIGLENGDMVFLGCYAATDHTDARNILTDLLTQAYGPMQQLAQESCDKIGIVYGGIDPAYNPGLSLPDSIGKGLEDLIGVKFGQPGTLAGVATLTSSIKALPPHLKLCGYGGLMLPVMEDLVLAERANEGHYRLQDLLFFSAVCGVGLDTVPIPLDSDPATLCNIYMDMAAMAFRLNKPLTCRLLPVDQQPGELTRIESPFLCNTKVFALA